MDKINYERAKEKSVGEDKVIKISYNKGKKVISKLLIVTASASILMTASVGCIGYDLKEKYMTNKKVSEYTSYGRNLVLENCKHTVDSKDYYYEIGNIALSLKEDPENFDINLYGVYSEISYQAPEQMNKIFAYLSNNTELTDCKNWSEYLKSFGCLKEDGSYDIEKYKEKMDKYICSLDVLNSLKEQPEEKGIGGK